MAWNTLISFWVYISKNTSCVVMCVCGNMWHSFVAVVSLEGSENTP